VKDRKFYSEPGDNYPKPTLPADEAWADMNSMLDVPPPGPPEPGHNYPMPGGSNLFWVSITAIVLVTASVITYYRHACSKSTAHARSLTAKNKSGQLIPGNKDTLGASDGRSKIDKIIKANDAGSIDTASIIASPGGSSKTPTVLTPDEKIHDAGVNDNVRDAPSPKNNQEVNTAKGIQGNASMKPSHRMISAVNGQHNRGMIRNDANPFSAGSFAHRAQIVRNHHRYSNALTAIPVNISTVQNAPGSTGKFHTKLNINATKQRQSIMYIQVSTSYLADRIESFMKEPIARDAGGNIQPDSLRIKLIGGFHDLVASKKHRSGSKGKASAGHNKKAAGYDYGLQWDAALPVQGSANYFMGTNAKSRPWQSLLPGLWLRKNIDSRSAVLLTINISQQYLTGNRQVAFVRDTIQRDSGFRKKSVYKLSGFGASIEYSRQLFKNWGAAIGFSYTINRQALLYQQNTNLYSGTVLSQSLYGIKRSDADWQYITGNLAMGKLELYHTFKKLDIGAAASVPITAIPVYGSKNIHPLNASIFLRWDIKRN
jgi:hypothetical protein